MFVRPEQMAEVARRHAELKRLRLVVTRAGEMDAMTCARSPTRTTHRCSARWAKRCALLRSWVAQLSCSRLDRCRMTAK